MEIYNSTQLCSLNVHPMTLVSRIIPYHPFSSLLIAQLLLITTLFNKLRSMKKVCFVVAYTGLLLTPYPDNNCCTATPTVPTAGITFKSIDYTNVTLSYDIQLQDSDNYNIVSGLLVWFTQTKSFTKPYY